MPNEFLWMLWFDEKSTSNVGNLLWKNYDNAYLLHEHKLTSQLVNQWIRALIVAPNKQWIRWKIHQKIWEIYLYHLCSGFIQENLKKIGIEFLFYIIIYVFCIIVLTEFDCPPSIMFINYN